VDAVDASTREQQNESGNHNETDGDQIGTKHTMEGGTRSLKISVEELQE
jgi:hypothetical protein